MSKYSSNRFTPSAKKETHVVWRGIGLLLMIIVPIISWLGGEELVAIGKEQNWPFIWELTGYVQFPAEVFMVPVISNIAGWIASIEDLPAKLFLGFLILVVLSGIVSVVYAAVYRSIVPRYGRFDAPAPVERVRKKF